jgi:hypothetical protein
LQSNVVEGNDAGDVLVVFEGALEVDVFEAGDGDGKV